MNRDKRKKMRVCSHLLPPPGGEVVRECLDALDTMDRALKTFDDKLRKCKQGHKYFADEDASPCPYCRIVKVENTLRRFVSLKNFPESDPFEVGCYCTSTDEGELRCAWCLAEDLVGPPRTNEDREGGPLGA